MRVEELQGLVSERLKLRLRATLSREVVESLSVRIEDVSDFVADHLAIEAGLELASVKLDPVTQVSNHLVTFRVPSGPWQMMKQKYARALWMRLLILFHFGHHPTGIARREIRYITHTRTATAEMTVEPLAILPQCDEIPNTYGKRIMVLSGYKTEWIETE